MIDIFSRARDLKKNLTKEHNEFLNRRDMKREKKLKVLKAKNKVSAKKSKLSSDLKREKKKSFDNSFIGKLSKQAKKSKKKGGAKKRAEAYANRKAPDWL